MPTLFGVEYVTKEFGVWCWAWLVKYVQCGYNERKGRKMRVRDLSPLVTDWQDGKTRVASTWESVDTVRRLGNDNVKCRQIFHYVTMMGEFVYDGTWVFVPCSTGWGSVSDQKGMNQILDGMGMVYRRNGGNPRYVFV